MVAMVRKISVWDDHVVVYDVSLCIHAERVDDREVHLMNVEHMRTLGLVLNDPLLKDDSVCDDH